MQKVVFLDRDDTIVKNVPYCSRPEDLHVFDFSGKAIKKLNDAGFLTFIVTNQSGINRGFLDRDDLEKIHEKLNSSLKKAGAHIDEIFFCPHRPDESCACRKPEIGMFIEASKKYEIFKDESFMIGDSESDVLAGKNFGLKTILIKKETSYSEILNPDFEAKDLLDAVDNYILRR